MALELAGDVAEVYTHADEQTKRGYQAFFTKLYVTLDDGSHVQSAVRIKSADLTEPYSALLSRDFVRKATNEVELIPRPA